MVYTRKSDKGVTHWTDGKATWKLGILGFLLRLRGYVVTILLGLPLAGVPFWWPQSIPENIQFRTTSFFIHGFIIFATIFTGSFFYIRQRIHQSLCIKAEFHNLIHESRDALCGLLKRNVTLVGEPSMRDIDNERTHLIEFSRKACDIIARYFEIVLGDKSIGCSIRLGIDNPSDNVAEVSYATIARSGTLNCNRGATSQPISRTEGIPKFFLQPDVARRGILFYDNLEKAAANGAYLKTKNDDLYKDEIKTMIVAPINGWNGVKDDLLGLLYVTSGTNKILNPGYIDIMRFCADSLATLYTGMFARLHVIGCMPNIRGDQKNAVG